MSGGLAEDWLVTPQFTPEASAPVLTFAQRQSFITNYGSVYTVRVSTLSQSNHADFTTVDTQTEDDFTYYYTMREVDLSAYIGTPIYVAFVMENDDADNWYVDDVDLIAGGGGAGPPSFTSGGDVTSSEDQGPVTISGWATDINGNGGAGLNFVVTPDDHSRVT